MTIRVSSHNLATFSTEDIMRHRNIRKSTYETAIQKETYTGDIGKRCKMQINLLLDIYPEFEKIDEANNDDSKENHYKKWIEKLRIAKYIKTLEIINEEMILESFKKSNNFKELNGYDGSTLKNQDLKKGILSGEIIIEEKLKFQNQETPESIEEKKNKKNATKIINNINAITKIINNDFKKEQLFITEHLSDINLLINEIYFSLKVLGKISDRLDDAFKDLKSELTKGLNRKEGFINSTLYKINQIIPTLLKD